MLDHYPMLEPYNQSAKDQHGPSLCKYSRSPWRTQRCAMDKLGERHKYPLRLGEVGEDASVSESGDGGGR
jgi:hypothetical protein